MTAAPAQTAPRKISAAILRAYALNLQAAGRVAALTPYLSAQTRPLVASPPLPTEWVDSAIVYEVYEAVGRVYGPAAVRQLAYEAMRDTLGPVIKPIIDVTMAIHGHTPGALLSNFERISSTFLRDINFNYRPEGSNSGLIEVSYELPAVRMAFAAWEGVFTFVVDLTGVRGTVGPCEPNAQLTYGRMHLTWE